MNSKNRFQKGWLSDRIVATTNKELIQWLHGALEIDEAAQENPNQTTHQKKCSKYIPINDLRLMSQRVKPNRLSQPQLSKSKI